MAPPEAQVFEPRMIARGPDKIRGSVDSVAFIYTKYPDPEGSHWFVKPGYVGHEEMTNTRGMLQALFGPEADSVYQQVVAIGDVFGRDEHGLYAPTGANMVFTPRPGRSGRIGTGARSGCSPGGRICSAGRACCSTGR